jgi:hypothetical protein
MSDPREDRELEEYLEGGSPLSRRYREASGEQPAPGTDEAILAASRRAVQSRPECVPTLIPRTWFKPLSLAAIIVLSATIVITLQRDDVAYAPAPEPVTTQPGSPMTGQDARQEVESDEAAAAALKLREEPPRQTTPEPAQLRPPSALPQAESVPQAEPDAAAWKEAPALRITRPRAAEMQMPDQKTPQPAMIMRESESAVSAYAPSPSRQPEAELNEIVQLWTAGQQDRALGHLRAFLAAHPQYPDAELRRVLPPDLYAEVRPAP